MTHHLAFPLVRHALTPFTSLEPFLVRVARVVPTPEANQQAFHFLLTFFRQFDAVFGLLAIARHALKHRQTRMTRRCAHTPNRGHVVVKMEQSGRHKDTARWLCVASSQWQQLHRTYTGTRTMASACVYIHTGSCTDARSQAQQCEGWAVGHVHACIAPLFLISSFCLPGAVEAAHLR